MAPLLQCPLVAERFPSARLLAMSYTKWASTQDVPSTISTSGEQVLVLISGSEASNLAEALSATKASFPNATR
jgi:hypothetical protein